MSADRPALLARAAEAAALAGRNRRAVELSDAALRELDENAEPVRAGVLHARRGWYLFQGGYGLEEALAGLHRAIELIPPAPPSLERVEALSKLARALVLSGRPEEGRRRADRGAGARPVARCARRGVRAPELARHQRFASRLARRGDRAPARGSRRRTGRRAIRRASGSPTPTSRACSATLCRFGEAIEVALEGADACRRLGIELTHGLFCLGNAAENLIDLGRFDEAERVLATALDHDVGESTRFHLHLMSAQLAAGQGRHDVAERPSRAGAGAWRDRLQPRVPRPGGLRGRTDRARTRPLAGGARPLRRGYGARRSRRRRIDRRDAAVARVARRGRHRRACARSPARGRGGRGARRGGRARTPRGASCARGSTPRRTLEPRG